MTSTYVLHDTRIKLAEELASISPKAKIELFGIAPTDVPEDFLAVDEETRGKALPNGSSVVVHTIVF